MTRPARVLPAVLLLICAGAAQPQSTPIDHALQRMYNFDFKGAHAVLDQYAQSAPEDPLLYSVRAAAHLFSEFERLGILESEFFGDDDRIGSRKRLKPDPAVRAQVLQLAAEARRRAFPQFSCAEAAPSSAPP